MTVKVMNVKIIAKKTLGFVAIIIALSGCAGSGQNKDDPWEGWNRGVYKFNKVVDDNIARPVAVGYKAVTPDIVEKGVSNVFSNLDDVPNMLNNLLQGKVGDSFSDLGRFLINSTLGIAGIWDPASSMGLAKHDEDFGQTLGAWGVGSGPYVMLPLLGPSTLRDTVAMPVDSQMSLLSEVDHIRTRNQIRLIQLVDKRAGLIKYEDQLKDATDEYAFVRSFFLQNRNYKVLDGNLPFEDECEDDDDCDF